MVHNSMNEDDSKGFIKFGLALSIIAGLSFWGEQEFFSSATLDSHMEDTYPHTYVGRRLANQEDMRKKRSSCPQSLAFIGYFRFCQGLPYGVSASPCPLTTLCCRSSRSIISSSSKNV